MEWRAEPGPAGDPAQSSDWASVARPLALGSHSVLVRGPEGRAQADQREVWVPPNFADVPRRLSPAALHRSGRWLL